MKESFYLKMKTVVFFFFMLFSCILNAQGNKMDSLQLAFNMASSDTTRFRIAVALCNQCKMSDNIKYANQAIKIADRIVKNSLSREERKSMLRKKAEIYDFVRAFYEENGNYLKCIEAYRTKLSIYKEIDDKEAMSNTLSIIAIDYSINGDIPNALKTCQDALVYFKKVNHQGAVAYFYSMLGSFYSESGDFIQSEDNYLKSLSLYQGIKDTARSAEVFENLGTLFGSLHNLSKSLKYFKQSLEICELSKGNNFVSKFYIYNSIAQMYRENGLIDSALTNSEISLSIARERNNQYWVALLLDNIGDLYEIKDVDRGISYHKEALEINKKLNIEGRIAKSYEFLAKAYFKKKDYLNAEKCIEIALTTRRKQNSAIGIRDDEQITAKIDSAIGDYKEAYYHFQEFIFYRDKLNNEAVHKAAISENFQKEYDKQKAIDKVVQEKKDEVSAGEKKKQKIIIWSVVCGLLLVIIFSIFLFQRFRITNRQKKVIEEQKALVDQAFEKLHEKNKEVIDSINYAQRIQKSQLPTEKYIEKNLNRLKKK